MPNLRLFTGIAIAPEVVEKLARILDELRPLAKLNWSPAENLHLTTKFIGAWPEERLPELKTALESVQFGKTFEISIARFGYFPNPHHPHSFFADVQTGPELAELAGRIGQALLPLGIPQENRPFTPHLTLARIKPPDRAQRTVRPVRSNGDVRKLRQHISKMTDLDFGKFTVSEFHLYLSKPGPSGSVYTILSSYSLMTESVPA